MSANFNQLCFPDSKIYRFEYEAQNMRLPSCVQLDYYATECVRATACSIPARRDVARDVAAAVTSQHVILPLPPPSYASEKLSWHLQLLFFFNNGNNYSLF
jgi:hypothetical protein